MQHRIQAVELPRQTWNALLAAASNGLMNDADWADLAQRGFASSTSLTPAWTMVMESHATAPLRMGVGIADDFVERLHHVRVGRYATCITDQAGSDMVQFSVTESHDAWALIEAQLADKPLLAAPWAGSGLEDRQPLSTTEAERRALDSMRDGKDVAAGWEKLKEVATGQWADVVTTPATRAGIFAHIRHNDGWHSVGASIHVATDHMLYSVDHVAGLMATPPGDFCGAFEWLRLGCLDMLRRTTMEPTATQ